MRPRWIVIWLTVSLALNAALLVAWLRELRPDPVPQRAVGRRLVVTNLLRPIRTNLVFQPRMLTWSDIESADYPTYVRNLRGLGCPPETVRDIILADVNALFARRLQAEVPSLAQQWWRLEPDAELKEQVTAKQAEIEAERRKLLAGLLGAAWEEDDPQREAGGQTRELAGPLLGNLSDEARRQVRVIERQTAEQLEARSLEAKAQGKTLSEAELARLERASRAQLAAVLSPEQLEEYLLRYSPAAQRLRKQLHGLDATPEEFRSIYRTADALEAQALELADTTDAASQKRRADLAKELEQTLERELGPARYLRQQLNQDAVFRETWNVAERAGVAAEKVIPLYQLNQAAAEERQRVLADHTLTPEEQTRQLALLYEQRLATLRTLLGEEDFRKFQAEAQP